jgi:hypothetical protein
MEDFPDVLRDAATAEGLTPDQRALIEAPELRGFWQRLAAHVPVLAARGWSSLTAAAMLVGAVVIPLALGHDARGTAARRVRRKINMARRRKAARDARALAATLRAIQSEPLAPDVVLSLLTCLPESVRDMIGPATPSYVWTFRTADALDCLADGLEVEPDLSEAPGLASQKPSWRGYLREVVAALGDLGFQPREVDMVRLVAVLCRLGGVMPPSRDAVHDALREGQPRTLA